eukprot:5686250-Alexandrium_andersonii.AAC.1
MLGDSAIVHFISGLDLTGAGHAHACIMAVRSASTRPWQAGCSRTPLQPSLCGLIATAAEARTF